MVVVPSPGAGMSLMHKSLEVPPDTNLVSKALSLAMKTK